MTLSEYLKELVRSLCNKSLPELRVIDMNINGMRIRSQL
jgi:hypothetical protein